MTLRLQTKGWTAAADAFMDEGVRSGAMKGIEWNNGLTERRKLVTRVIFFLNITKFGDYACAAAVSLIVVDIPEGVVSLDHGAFMCFSSLTTVSFPTTLTSIGEHSFCTSLRSLLSLD
ncbi:hypothetical protein TrLO_g151 [Triparma laevis f. longispina]|uniref:Uncharacterized protein n=1 Tax=Triparma laevis f. longispina TaxID=1714387 RepID=A0A9W7F0S0_9STRA|nr:hypothetical protein TrLO_g151 [Triparma laevis f. longispina]